MPVLYKGFRKLPLSGMCRWFKCVCVCVCVCVYSVGCVCSFRKIIKLRNTVTDLKSYYPESISLLIF